MKKIFFITFFLLITTTISGANSICNADEETLFSCTMQNNKKLSICGLDRENQIIVNYKYGKPNKIELIFPQEPQTNNDLFKYNHYSRYQTDYFRIAFVNDDYGYEVYRTYDGTSPHKINAGITAAKLSSTKSYNNECKTIHVDNLIQLSNYLNCDEEHAFGCY